MAIVKYIKLLYQFKELLWIWIERDIKIRYKQSFLGAAWAILQPLIMMLMFSIVFSRLISVSSDGFPYPVFSYLALLPWTFFASSINFGSLSLINNLNLVTKTYFPREILPIGSIGAALFDFLIASSIFFLLMIFYQIHLSWSVLLVPMILLVQIILTLGVTLLASALIVIFRDIRFIVPLGIQIWFYATPIIYSTSLIPERFRALYMLNPMAGVIDAYRSTLLYGQLPNWKYLAIASIVSIFIFVLGYYVFKHLEKTFPDII